MDTVEVAEEIIKSGTFLGMGTLWEFVLRYGINIIIAVVLVRVIYYPRHRNKDFVFTFLLFNTVILLICVLLSGTKLKQGFAFGLFAIFSIIRYRTVTVPIREMGYFFVSVTLGLINGLSEIGNWEDLVAMSLANCLVLVVVYLLDRQLSLDHENYKEVNYERIDLIKPDRREDMLNDLRLRTGLPVHRIEIMKIDFLRDVARIHAFYYSKENEMSSRDMGGDDD